MRRASKQFLARVNSIVGRHGAGIFLSAAILSIIFIQWKFMWAGPFWDDHHIFQDEVIEKGLSPLLYWTRGQVNTRAWPLFFTIEWAIFGIFGTKLAAYRCLNILFHALNGILIFLIGRKLKFRLPWVPAVIFLVHPVGVETVSWIFQFSKILSASFLLLWLYFSIDEKKRAGTLAFRLLSLLGAMLVGSYGYFFSFLEIFRLSGRKGFFKSRRGFLLSICIAVPTIYLIFLASAGLMLTERTGNPTAAYNSWFPGIFQCDKILANATQVQNIPRLGADQSVQSAALYASEVAGVRSLQMGPALCLWSMKLGLAGSTGFNYAGRLVFPILRKVPWPPKKIEPQFFPLFLIGGLFFLCLTIYACFTNILLAGALLAFLPISGLFFFTWLTISQGGDRLIYVTMAFFILYAWQKLEPWIEKRMWAKALGLVWIGFLLIECNAHANYLWRIYEMPLRSFYLTPDP